MFLFPYKLFNIHFFSCHRLQSPVSQTIDIQSLTVLLWVGNLKWKFRLVASGLWREVILLLHLRCSMFHEITVNPLGSLLVTQIQIASFECAFQFLMFNTLTILHHDFFYVQIWILFHLMVWFHKAQSTLFNQIVRPWSSIFRQGSSQMAERNESFIILLTGDQRLAYKFLTIVPGIFKPKGHLSCFQEFAYWMSLISSRSYLKIPRMGLSLSTYMSCGHLVPEKGILVFLNFVSHGLCYLRWKFKLFLTSLWSNPFCTTKVYHQNVATLSSKPRQMWGLWYQPLMGYCWINFCIGRWYFRACFSRFLFSLKWQWMVQSYWHSNSDTTLSGKTWIYQF